MLNVVEKSLCTGCAVCSKICHKEAIHMNMDENGFLYPEIEQNKCVDCRQCIKICPVSNPPKVSEKTYAYAYQNKDNHIVKFSTPTENTLWQVFSVYTIEAESYYITTDFNDDSFKT